MNYKLRPSSHQVKLFNFQTDRDTRKKQFKMEKISLRATITTPMMSEDNKNMPLHHSSVSRLRKEDQKLVSNILQGKTCLGSTS